MYGIESFVKDFRKETATCIHFFQKLPPGGLDYRPTAGQRSTQELLRYLSYGPYNAVRRVVAGDWNIGKPTNEVTKDWPASDFPRNMTWQCDEVERLVRSASPVALANDDFTFPWGETFKKGEALVRVPLKWLGGYKMQLFLYAKAAGASDLKSADLWYFTPPKA
jgi:hypothetical protein